MRHILFFVISLLLFSSPLSGQSEESNQIIYSGFTTSLIKDYKSIFDSKDRRKKRITFKKDGNSIEGYFDGGGYFDGPAKLINNVLVFPLNTSDGYNGEMYMYPSKNWTSLTGYWYLVLRGMRTCSGTNSCKIKYQRWELNSQNHKTLKVWTSQLNETKKNIMRPGTCKSIDWMSVGYDKKYRDFTNLKCNFKNRLLQVLSGFHWSDFSGSDFSKSFLPVAGGFIGTKFDKAKFVGSVISQRQLPYKSTRSVLDKLSSYLPNNLGFTSFRNADLTCATFINVDLTGADFTGADLSGTRFYYSDLSNAIFDKSLITQNSFNTIKINSSVVQPSAELQNKLKDIIDNLDSITRVSSKKTEGEKNLERQLRNINKKIYQYQDTYNTCNNILTEIGGYSGPQFIHSNLNGTSFINAKLYYSYFDNIFANKINFSGANISGSKFESVDLRNSLNLNTAILNEVKYIKSLVGNISKVSDSTKKETTSSINLRVQTGSNSQTSSLSVSDNGNLLITGHENGEAVVWSIQTGKEISKFYIGNDNPIIDSKIYGNKAIISDGIKISVFDLIDSKPISTSLVRTDEKGSPSIKLSNDGEFAVVDKLYLWDIKKNKKKFDLEKSNSLKLNQIKISKDSRYVYGNDEITIYVWLSKNGRLIRKNKVKKGKISGIELSNDLLHYKNIKKSNVIATFDVKKNKIVKNQKIKINPDDILISGSDFFHLKHGAVINIVEDSKLFNYDTENLTSINKLTDNLWSVIDDQFHIKLYANTGENVSNLRGMISTPDFENLRIHEDYIQAGEITWNLIKGKLINLSDVDLLSDDESMYNLSIIDGKLTAEDSDFNIITEITWSGIRKAFNHKNTSIIGVGAPLNQRIRIWDIKSNEIFDVSHDNPVVATSISENDRTLAVADETGGIAIYDISKKVKKYVTKQSPSKVFSIRFLNNNLVTSHDDGAIRIWKNNGLLASLVTNHNSEWAVVAANGQFDRSPGFDGMHWVRGTEVIDLDQFFDDFYTPGLLSQVYQTGELDETRSLDDALKQVIPTIEIIEPKKTTTRGLQLAADDSTGCKVVSSQTRGFKKKKKKKKIEEPGCGDDGTLRVVAKVTDQGGGFQDIVLYHNGKRLESVEGEVKSGTAQKGKTKLVTFRVPLASGENYLRAEAKSLSRVRARPWQMVVDFEAPKPKGKPDLYLYVVGINKYSNSKYNLNYGRPDAEAVQKALGDKLKLGAFEKVHVSGIYDLEATKENITAQFLKFAKQARPRDIFIFYYAGHGRTLKDENGNPVFYLVSSNVEALDQDKTVKKGGLSGLELINYSKKIRAGKQMFLFDACESGSVAKAFASIQKNTGGHILYAAASNQLATEFDSLGHGIFTYTLLKTLEDNKKLNVSLLSGGMDFLLEELRPEFNLTDQTFGYYRTLEAPNFAIKSM